ncbi:hypothetical protein [Parachlamydia sp. AcF125]|uniref:hypothetical protein n=1 Tax=Parachlamydia sp. AcF125 TaxID=2795736 RepID=UPI001BC9C5CC|nr:hypothetical protein [Parachlamydia sp. AcF125]MBS4168547.1 hypothetical protein [Parachlamydia sp. AcF125]
MSRINEFKEFSIGQSSHYRTIDVKKNTGEKVSIEQAVKAVGGNAIQNFINRFILFFKNHEWYTASRIKDKLKTHDYETLMHINELFRKAYPDDTQVDDPRILNFMNHFVHPRLVKQGNKEFASTLSGNSRLFLKELKKEHPAVVQNLAKLVKANISPADLFNKFGRENPTGILEKLKDNAEVDRMIEEIEKAKKG